MQIKYKIIFYSGYDSLNPKQPFSQAKNLAVILARIFACEYINVTFNCAY